MITALINSGEFNNDEDEERMKKLGFATGTGVTICQTAASIQLISKKFKKYHNNRHKHIVEVFSKTVL